MKNKHIKLIIIIYCSVLVISTLLYYVISKQVIVKANINDEYSSSTYSEQEPKKAIKELKSKNLLDRYKVGSYKFDKDTLKISTDDGIKQVILERKGTNDSKIEVYSLSDPALVWKNKIQNVFTEPNIVWDGNELNINNTSRNFRFAEFTKNNTITQFSIKEDSKERVVFDRMQSGESYPQSYDSYDYMDFSQYYSEYPKSIIYVEIPKDLKVDGFYDGLN